MTTRTTTRGSASGPAPRVLVAEDDRAVARYLQTHLALDGLEVTVVHDGGAALARATAAPPQLLIAAMALPGVDGLELVRRLRAQPATTGLPILLLTAQPLVGEKVAALFAGADDCLVKPFDTLELLARVRTTLRRTSDMRALSPLTGLPGNHRIEAEIATLAASGAPYAVCHVDLDEFKSFNDAYGFLRGDDLLLALSRCLVAAAGRAGEPPVFVGHVGGDDFVLVCTPGQAEPLGREVIAAFDAELPGHYDPVDAARGHLAVVDRRGDLRQHPLVSVSIGIAPMTGGSRDHRAVVATACEMKTVAKGQPGSVVAVDQRH